LRIPIRWRDIDALGHVNNAVYLTYLEELLTEAVGPVLGDDYVTARVELDFRNEIRLGDREANGTVAVEHIGGSSVTLGVTLVRVDGRTALEGRVEVVPWDREQRRSRLLTAEEAEALERI